ncbi:Hypothetical protein DPCES_1626 [Desulfitobacterium hafniense]|uniref:Uncharacterized protein n=1 Tax=Desulfitobacterium hafniense TaxID=49338 RepID=A0A098AY14_DESHA|nr:hypothetical protein [Desulfitobacterium hafniense]CDX01513.1 Hypothetical protein DPCES_1626 [Desulfitobacterium hafniense]
MTAYELFEKVYKHYMRNSRRHLWTGDREGTTPKAYIEQSFSEALEECSVEYAYSNGFKLLYNPANKIVVNLRQIEMQSGYYLCFYDGHTGEWLMMYYDSKSGALAAYRELYDKYFKSMDWFWIVKIK